LSAAVALFAQRLQLGDGLEVSGTTGGPFDANQPVQVETLYVAVKHPHSRCVLPQLLEASATGQLAQEVKISET
jgi:hypothetical protein